LYAVLFPSGKVLSFSVLAVAETYVLAYKGILLSNPQDRMGFTLIQDPVIINA
jgi:hypothetical protein